MILKNQLYKIENKQVDGDSANYVVGLNSDCFIYKAHFPNNPITPGVCIVQTARELLEDIVGRPLEITEAKDVKFLNILSPNDHKQVTFSFSDIIVAADCVKAKVTVANGETVFTTIAFTCA